MSAAADREVRVEQWRAGELRPAQDRVAVEAPLTITLRRAGQPDEGLAITMRTPATGADRADRGDQRQGPQPSHDERKDDERDRDQEHEQEQEQDHELALGFLFAEGVIAAPSDLLSVLSTGPDGVLVELSASAPPLPKAALRRFTVSSACGVCGRGALQEAAAVTEAPGRDPFPLVAPATLLALPTDLRAAQPAFGATGGLHAAALFTPTGEQLLLREDVGRHNAVDKLVGRLWLDRGLPATEAVLLLSGRASFELVDKAARAGIRVVAALGAPSSLAIATAEAAGITLIGFLRADRFNVYAHAARVRGSGSP